MKPFPKDSETRSRLLNVVDLIACANQSLTGMVRAGASDQALRTSITDVIDCLATLVKHLPKAKP